MPLPDWKDLPLLTRRSKKKRYELIKEELNALEEPSPNPDEDEDLENEEDLGEDENLEEDDNESEEE